MPSERVRLFWRLLSGGVLYCVSVCGMRTEEVIAVRLSWELTLGYLACIPVARFLLLSYQPTRHRRLAGNLSLSFCGLGGQTPRDAVDGLRLRLSVLARGSR